MIDQVISHHCVVEKLGGGGPTRAVLEYGCASTGDGRMNMESRSRGYNLPQQNAEEWGSPTPWWIKGGPAPETRGGQFKVWEYGRCRVSSYELYGVI